MDIILQPLASLMKSRDSRLVKLDNCSSKQGYSITWGYSTEDFISIYEEAANELQEKLWNTAFQQYMEIDMRKLLDVAL